ncbi:translocation/assembly module TamB domain-containing protein [Fuscovulum ytuae]|uniref:Translocation/assembly module TamB domain-containing protein n=1 Tax=Fuscovulum ytuae TaxID=3042299 RepID=A0ABY8Q504_9RHOB|nr:translocation/assembly module TamB domain-containing protein [Fuscovulum sp. YMD61]WGV15257.1 translocation/assembly module TamB domain-containing protein [Fuscovulum sp. YMD61]
MWGARSFLGVLAFCLLPMGAVAQEDDRDFLTAFLEDNLSGAGRQVTITGFAGALSSRATIDRLTIADDAGVWLSLDGVVLDWSRSALLRGEVNVAELSAREIVLERVPEGEEAPPSPEAGTFALPELPVSISIGRLAAERIVLGEAVLGEAITGRLEASASLAGGEGRTELLLERVDDGPDGRLDLTAAYGNESGLLTLDLLAEEAAGGIAVTKLGIPGAPSARLSVQGEGPVSDFVATVGLVTDGQERLAGTVELLGAEDGGQGFKVDLAGDLAPLWMPDYAAFFGERIALRAEGERSALGVLRLRELDLAAQAITLRGAAVIGADGVPASFDLRGRIALADGSPVLLPVSGEVRVRSVDLDVGYDRAAGEGWTADLVIAGLDQPGLVAERLALDGAGRLWRRDGAVHLGAVLDFAGRGVVPEDAALATALGSEVDGSVVLSWRDGGDGLRLPKIALNGQGYGMEGRAVIAGLDEALEVSGRAEARVDDLARLSGLVGRPLGGAARVVVEGAASPLTGAFDGEVMVEGTDVALGQAQVDALLRGLARIGVSAKRDETGTELRSLSVAAGSLDATAQGRVTSGDLDLTARVDFRDLAALGGGFRGSLVGDLRVTGAPDGARLVLQGRGRDLAVGQTEADRLLQGETVLALDLETGAALTLNRVEVSNPQVMLRAASKGEALDLTARIANLALLLPEFPGPLTVTGTAAQEGGLRLDLRGLGPGGIDARVAGLLRDDGTADLTIAGQAQAGLANAFLAGQLVSGPVRFDLRMNGPAAVSSLSGQVALSGGRISDPSVFFALQDVGVTANLGQGRAQLLGGAALTSGGRIDLGGTVGMVAPFAADLRVGILGAVLRDPELFQTTANGEVTLRGPLTGGAAVGGQIVLSGTEVQIPSTGLGGAADIPDLRHVNEPGAVRETRARAGLLADGPAGGGGGRPFALDLTISAPSQIYIRGRGLDAELGGELRLGGTTAAVVPSGAFDLIRGRLDILGKRLDLTQASLTLEGDFVPMLAVAASNQSDGITSFVRIDGPATEPEVSFTSTPELPEEEVLSRLLFGRGINSLSALQAAQLASAVATLAGRGGIGIVGRLREGFGLDDLDVQTGAEGGATVRAGKYLSENVYSQVEVDAKGQSQINLNLDVTDSITLRGSAGSAGGTGVGIFFEKDY